MTTRRIGGRRPNAPAVEPYRPRSAPTPSRANERGRGNRADAVYGPAKIQERINRLGELSRNPANRAVLDRRTTLGQMIRAMMGEILAYVPVDTGRLYRSFRIRIHGNGVILWFEAPYAIFVEFKSKRNRHWFRRGLASGIRKANRIGKAAAQRSGVALSFSAGQIMRRGRGGATSEVTYEYAFTS